MHWKYGGKMMRGEQQQRAILLPAHHFQVVGGILQVISSTDRLTPQVPAQG